MVPEGTMGPGIVPARPQGDVGSAGRRWDDQVLPMRMVGFFGEMGANQCLKIQLKTELFF